ncbi:MAG TPA: hypothetical protein VD927_19275 [Chryseosolibacter sp.]|nr:hypothetical protein [Chryseosolibacter sp.]
MNTASLNDIRIELKNASGKQLVEYCLRLARHKKENKELLTYLLFDAENEPAYVNMIKEEIDEQFSSINMSNVYYTKKTLRKILRVVNRQIKYSGVLGTEIETRIYFCHKMLENKVPLKSGTILFNLYEQQLKKIHGLVAKLPEDIQPDYDRDIRNLTIK